MQTLLRFLYLSSLILWIGSIFFFSFISSRSVFKILPREMAGDLVADIFPKYYLIAYICGGVALVSTILYWITGYSSSGIFYSFRVALLSIMLVLAIYSGTVIRPNAHELRIEMRSLSQDTAKYKELQNGFRSLHKQSATLNLTIFLFGIAIIALTAYNYRE